MSRVILFSSLFGDYDIARPITDVGVECVLFSDKPQPSAHGWIVDTAHTQTVKQYSHPRLKAKYFKMHAAELFGTSYDVSIYLDASWIVESPFFVKELVEQLGDDPIAFFPHRWRNNVKDELAAHLPIQKYWGLPIERQVASYFADGFKDDAGLMEMTCIPARHNDERVKAFYESWWAENVKWSYADQLSAPYCAWKTGLPIKYLAQNLDAQKWFRLAAWRADI